MARQRRSSRLRDAGGCLGDVPPLRSWSFFENVGLNEAIWCTIFRHVKHLTACLLAVFFYFRTGWSKKWRGHAPSLKSGGATGPPGPVAYADHRPHRKLWQEISELRNARGFVYGPWAGLWIIHLLICWSSLKKNLKLRNSKILKKFIFKKIIKIILARFIFEPKTLLKGLNLMHGIL